uniref:Uncharacterized protein n=1 Tax=Leersia perrieri TaxID=77586 RepID=A0A0D9XU92_9ORYZ
MVLWRSMADDLLCTMAHKAKLQGSSLVTVKRLRESEVSVLGKTMEDSKLLQFRAYYLSLFLNVFWLSISMHHISWVEHPYELKICIPDNGSENMHLFRKRE